jgi:cobaltochelatase CobS
MKKYTKDTHPQTVADHIGHNPGELGENPLSAEQRTALKYFCRRWLGMSRDQCQSKLYIMRARYDSKDAIAGWPNYGTLLPMFDTPTDPDETPDTAPTIIQEPAPMPSQPETPPTPARPATDDAAALADILRRMAGGAPIDETAVRAIAKEEAAKAAESRAVTVKHEITIKTADETRTLPDEPRHEIFADVLACVAAGLNVLLVGPAGCGKTHLCQQVADALQRPFRFTGAVASEYKLTGFMNAQGVYVSTPFRESFEQGGVFLWDEMDASNPAAMLAFNGALANGSHDFPDQLVARHETFAAIASANTFGHGADRQYVGRNQMDAASLDRFATLAMSYDPVLETALYGDTDWTAFVQSARSAVADLKIRHVISMRATQQGAALLAAGMAQKQVEQITLWKHLDKADVSKIRNQMGD